MVRDREIKHRPSKADLSWTVSHDGLVEAFTAKSEPNPDYNPVPNTNMAQAFARALTKEPVHYYFGSVAERNQRYDQV